MIRYGFMLVLLGCLAEARPPNVLVILTDDQGWGDLSLHGNPNLATPNLDALARDGAQFEYFYVCQVCAPTRAEFLTGRYAPRTGVTGVSRGEERLNEQESTVAEVFKAAGYATGCFGKWHNGTQAPLHPNHKGFDTFYGFTSGHWGHYFSPPLDHDGKRVKGKGFIVDDFTDHAIQFIEANRERPFFCYLPLNTPHSPFYVPDRWYEKFKDAQPEGPPPGKTGYDPTRAALALCENIDWNVGRVLQRLDELMLRDHTIVLFFCDNGPNTYRWNGGMKGKKGSIDEGGLRSPCFVRWPEKIRAGLSIPQLTGAIDLRPTLLELAGVDALKQAKTLPLDGRSLAPLLRERDVAWPERSLFAYAPRKERISVRHGRYRLDSAGRLYDIPSDPGQTVDVAAQHPELTAALREQAEEHGMAMRRCVRAYQDRPFHVGWMGADTTLPARDGEPQGSVRRSVSSPNNSFFKDWTDVEASITWDIEVGQAGAYEATVYYTCAAGDEGAIIRLGVDEGTAVTATVRDAFDPPLWDKSKERVEESHYFMKDFKPMDLGTLKLEAGRQVLRLGAVEMKGERVIDVYAVDLLLMRE